MTVRWEEELRIGDDESAPIEYLFGMPTHVAVRSDGGFYIAEHNQKVIRQFDSTGNFVRTLGGPGEGPGEFMYLNDLTVGTDDRLHVVDQDAQRATVFSESGQLLYSKRLVADENYYPRHVAALSAGRIAVLSSRASENAAPVGENLATVFDSTLSNQTSSFFSSSEYFDLSDPFQRRNLISSSFNIASDGDDTVYISSLIYDGELIRATHGDAGWQLEVLDGYPVEKPHYRLREESYLELVNDPQVQPGLMRMWGMSGPNGGFTVEFPVLSAGLFVRADESVVQFLVTGTQSDTKLVAEVFGANGEFRGFGEVEGVVVSDPTKSHLRSTIFVPEAIDRQDRLFAVDFSTGYPVIRVLKLSIEFE